MQLTWRERMDLVENERIKAIGQAVLEVSIVQNHISDLHGLIQTSNSSLERLGVDVRQFRASPAEISVILGRISEIDITELKERLLLLQHYNEEKSRLSNELCRLGVMNREWDSLEHVPLPGWKVIPKKERTGEIEP
jgi:hypothetical protein